MSANLRLCYDNDHNNATLSVSGAGGVVTGFEAINTQNTIRTSRLRSVNVSSPLTLFGVVPEDRVANFFQLPRHSLLGANVAIEFFSDAAGTSSAFASGTNPVLCYSASTGYVNSRGSRDPFAARSPYWLYFDDVTYRSYKITFSGTPSLVPYYEVTRVYVGRYLEFRRNPDFGPDILGWIDLSTRKRTQGGTLRGNLGAMIRVLKFAVNDLTDDEAHFLADGFQQNGTVGEWAMSLFPGDGTRREALHTAAGTLAGLNAIGRAVGRLTNTLQFEEN